MSGKAGSIGSIILGVVLTIVGAAAGQPQWGLIFSGLLMVSGGAIGLAYSPKSDSQALAAQQDVKFTTAATGMPVPVVFGTARVTPNFIRANQGLLDAEEVTASGGGKGGGGSQTVGYNYFWSWEAALCMGKLEAVGQVFGMPGEQPMIDAEDAWVEFDTEEYVELTLAIANPGEEEQSGEPEGGVVRIFKGSETQTRILSGDAYAATGLNYRGTAFGVFGISSGGRRFSLGMSNFVKTYQFMVRRPCECLRDDDSTVTGLKVRGSDDTGNAAYHLSNPAAIYWETLTNKVWGRGLSSDILDEASFIAVSEYYAAQNIGLGLVLESPQDIGTFLEGIQKHCRTLLTWDGEVYKLSSLLDITATHGEILTLRDSDLIDLQLGVPFWESTANEVRAEFTSPERGERPDTIAQLDSGNVDILGGRIVTQRIQLPGFNDWNLAYQQVARILAEMSYPWRTAQWEMNRFNSHIAIGQVVRIIWTEFTTQIVTSYWLIVQITDGAAGDEKIKVRAVEDQLLAPVEGEELVVTLPDRYPWQRVIPVDPDEVYLEDTSDEPSTAFAMVFEVPAIVAVRKNEYEGQVYAFLPKYFPDMVGGFLWVKLASDSSYAQAKSGPAGRFGRNPIAAKRGVSGELVTAMDANFWSRDPAGIVFDVTTGDFFQDYLLQANEVPDDVTGLTELAESTLNYLFIEEEVCQVGLITEVSAGRFRMRNILRGCFGTTPMNHPVGTLCMFVRQGSSDAFVPLPVALEDNETDFRMSGANSSNQQVNDTVFDAQLFHYGDNNTKFVANSLRPLKPEPYSISDGGTDVTIVISPRLVTSGAGISNFNQLGYSGNSWLNPVSYVVEQYDAAETLLAPGITANVTSDSGFFFSVAERVLLSMDITKEAGVKLFRVYAFQSNRRSVEYAEFAL